MTRAEFEAMEVTTCTLREKRTGHWLVIDNRGTFCVHDEGTAWALARRWGHSPRSTDVERLPKVTEPLDLELEAQFRAEESDLEEIAEVLGVSEEEAYADVFEGQLRELATGSLS